MGRFECVFVVLHPFVRVPAELAWSATHRYPRRRRDRSARRESRVDRSRGIDTSLKSCARINQALLTSIGSLADHVADRAGATNCSASSNPSPSGCPPKAASSRFSSPTCFTFSRRRERKSFSSSPNSLTPIPWCGCPLAGLRNGEIPEFVSRARDPPRPRPFVPLHGRLGQFLHPFLRLPLLRSARRRWVEPRRFLRHAQHGARLVQLLLRLRDGHAFAGALADDVRRRVA